MHAANEGQDPLVELLLVSKANPDVRAPDGATALFIAVSRGRAEIVALLRQAGADPSLEGPDGRTVAQPTSWPELGDAPCRITLR